MRVAWRLAALVLHVLRGLATIYLVFPFVRRPARRRLIRNWARGVLRICGVALAVHGSLPKPRAGVGWMWVANHISWIDVFVLHAVYSAVFIAKSEIRRWPLLGALTAGAGTLFIERGSRHAVHHVNTLVNHSLDDGEIVVVFAEGTTSDGTVLLPFHSNLFATPVQRGAPIQPVALRYTEHGRPTTAPAFVGGQTLLNCLRRILRTRGLSAEVHLLDVLDPATMQPARAARHAAARQAEHAIATCLGLAIADKGPGKTPAEEAARP